MANLKKCRRSTTIERVEFIDGTTREFDSDSATHYSNDRIFIIEVNKTNIMIPEHAVKVVEAGHYEDGVFVYE